MIPTMDSSLLNLFAPFWVSIKLATVTTLCLLLLGTPVAYWLSRPSKHPLLANLKVMLMGVIALPLILPPTVIGFYLLLAFSPNYALGGWLVSQGIAPLAFTFQGLIIGSVIYSLPFFVQPVYAQFSTIPQSIHDAARLLEASSLRRFTRVLLPQAKVGLLLGSVVSFAHTIGEFGVVLMIGGSIHGKTKVVSIAIYEQVEALNYATAHQYALVLLLFSVMVIVLIAILTRNHQQRS